MVDHYCDKCLFLSKLYGMPSCNYIGIMGRSRGCPSGEGCTKRVIGNKGSSLKWMNHYTKSYLRRLESCVVSESDEGKE